jgi:hypothetical protein
MRWSSGFRALVFISGFFVASTVLAQTQADEIGQLPTTLSTEQLSRLRRVPCLRWGLASVKVSSGPGLSPAAFRSCRWLLFSIRL